MKRLFWLGVGMAAGAYVTRRATAAAHSLTPVGDVGPDAGGLRELGAGLGSFGAEVRAGMADRERELAAQVERRTGTTLPTVGEALTVQPTARAPRAGR